MVNKAAGQYRSAAQGVGDTSASRAGIHRGAEARARAEAEMQTDQQQREFRAEGKDLVDYNRRRFKLDDPSRPPLKEGYTPSYEADLIVLDRSWDDLAYVYEHNIEVDGRWGNFEMCVHETSICPVCAKLFGGRMDRKGDYVTHITVLDLREVWSERQGRRIMHIKRPLVIKKQVQALLMPLFKSAMDQHGTIRGMHLFMVRDTTLNSSVGRPVMMASLNGAMYEMLTEEQLVAEFDNEEVRDPETNELKKPAHFDIEPYPYLSILPDPSSISYVSYLRERYGSGSPATPGSRQDSENAWRNRGNSAGASTAPGAAPPRYRTRSQTTYEPRSQEAQKELAGMPPSSAPNATDTPRMQTRERATDAPTERIRERSRGEQNTQRTSIQRNSSAVATAIDDDIPF